MTTRPQQDTTHSTTATPGGDDWSEEIRSWEGHDVTVILRNGSTVTGQMSRLDSGKILVSSAAGYSTSIQPDAIAAITTDGRAIRHHTGH